MKMIRIDCPVSLVTFLWMIILVRGDTEVSCVFMGTCILPCSFQEDPKVVIRWTKLTEGFPRVHSFSKNQDQLEDQDQNFRNRTSLFKEQISRGNGSLQLTGVMFQDKGEYQCYTRTTSGIKKSVINLDVTDNPVIDGSIITIIIIVFFVGVIIIIIRTGFVGFTFTKKAVDGTTVCGAVIVVPILAVLVAAVVAAVGALVGALVGATVGAAVGAAAVGTAVGAKEGAAVEVKVGAVVGAAVGAAVGALGTTAFMVVITFFEMENKVKRQSASNFE